MKKRKKVLATVAAMTLSLAFSSAALATQPEAATEPATTEPAAETTEPATTEPATDTTQETTQETTGLLTPDGTGEIVDDVIVTYSGGELEFITVTTAEGNYYYIIIDNVSGEVYFLNQVDDYDLTSLLDDDEMEVYEEKLAESETGSAQQSDEDANESLLSGDTAESGETDGTIVSESEKSTGVDSDETEQASDDASGVANVFDEVITFVKENMTLVVLAVVVVVVLLLYFLIKIRGDRKNAGSEYEDDDNQSDADVGSGEQDEQNNEE